MPYKFLSLLCTAEEPVSLLCRWIFPMASCTRNFVICCWFAFCSEIVGETVSGTAAFTSHSRTLLSTFVDSERLSETKLHEPAD